MEKNTTEQLNAPLGVATSAPLPTTCIYCVHFSCAFDVPFCDFFECEISNVNNICEYYDHCEPEISNVNNICEYYDHCEPIEDLPF